MRGNSSVDECGRVTDMGHTYILVLSSCRLVKLVEPVVGHADEKLAHTLLSQQVPHRRDVYTVGAVLGSSPTLSGFVHDATLTQRDAMEIWILNVRVYV